MSGQPITGIERAVFGDITGDDIAGWLDRHVRTRLSTGLAEIRFRAGRTSGLRRGENGVITQPAG